MPEKRTRSPAKRGASAKASPRRARRPQPKKKWSADVMRKSDAMDLQPGVFKLRSPGAVARSLKKSAEASHRRKSPPFRSAMSMLNFEINRGGKNLSAEQRRVLNQAKSELRKLFGRPPA
ncbi:MAG: hypothetical protein JWN43_2003 [Gammaproteobacteria bacterium]|nr:hypothetical protein [Gammaproteobacteria bacterium]